MGGDTKNVHRCYTKLRLKDVTKIPYHFELEMPSLELERAPPPLSRAQQDKSCKVALLSSSKHLWNLFSDSVTAWVPALASSP